MKFGFFLIGVLILLSNSASSQQSFYLADPLATYKQAKEYFQKGYYGLAYPLFRDLDRMAGPFQAPGFGDAPSDVHLYFVVCSLLKGDSSIVEEGNRLLLLPIGKSRFGFLNFSLGEYYYSAHNYKKAIEYYERVGVGDLSNDQLMDLKFHQGYSYFTLQKFDQASPLLNALSQIPKGGHYLEANYYYGCVCFYQAKYNTALKAFEIASGSPEFSNLVSYYEANIFLIQHDNDKAIQYAAAQLAKGGQYYELELNHLVGHGYYQKQDFKKALAYLEPYSAKSTQLTKTDIFELAYCYYKTGNWLKGIAGFRSLSAGADTISQHADYLLADSYLQDNQRTNARNAFYVCISKTTNPVEREFAQFTYAKLSAELGYQDRAIESFREFLQSYPRSSNFGEARELMIQELARTNNYKDAQGLIDSIGSPSAKLKELYPRIYYGRAIELINDGYLGQAADLLEKAESVHPNKGQLSLIHFWKGEVAFRLNRLNDAIQELTLYLQEPQESGEANAVNAKYTLAYCYYKSENFRLAGGYFEAVCRTARVGMSPMEQDAFIRLGDCYYMQKDIKSSLNIYNKVLDLSLSSSDYALFQKAMIQGISNYSEKIATLNTLIRRYPNSNLVPDANLEIASSYLSNEKFSEALPYLKVVTGQTANSFIKPNAFLRAGIAYYNLNDNQAALNQYASLLRQFPNSPESQEALENVRSIYVEEGRSSEYVSFAKSVGVEISNSQEDQLAYQEAEIQFNNGNFHEALIKFEAYLKRFPEGKFMIDANYYKSEIYNNQKDWKNAVLGYAVVADHAPNKFSERALLLCARINFFNLKDYEAGAKYYQKLKDNSNIQDNRIEAMRGLLRCQFELKQWSDAVGNAKELLNEKSLGTDDKILCNMVLARSYQESGNCVEALGYFRTVSSLSKAAFGAEARYETAKCLFDNNQLKDAEKAAFEVINHSSSYEDWVTKAYFLLGDIFWQEKDLYNARATFQSLVDHVKDEHLRLEAKRKLELINSGEEEK